MSVDGKEARDEGGEIWYLLCVRCACASQKTSSNIQIILFLSSVKVRTFQYLTSP